MILLIDTPLQEMFFDEVLLDDICDVLKSFSVWHVVSDNCSIVIYAQKVCLFEVAMSRLFNDALAYFHYTLKFAASADNAEEFRLRIRSS